MNVRTTQVTVTPNGEHFTVAVIRDGGEVRFVHKADAIAETIKALDRAGYGQQEIHLVAPDWIKSEMKARGYRF